MTTLKEVSYDDSRGSLLDYLQAIGSVVDICVLQYEPDDGESNIARHAAVRGMQIFAERLDRRIAHVNDGQSPQSAFRIRIAGHPMGSPISFDTLLGPFFDFRTRRLVRGLHSEYAEYWLAGHGLHDGASNTYGLIDTILKPPYNLHPDQMSFVFPRMRTPWPDPIPRLDWTKWADLVEQIIAELFYAFHTELSEALLIHSWSTDWSNYFDSGKEWWGAHFWTVQIPGTGEIVVIGASSTD